MSYETTQMLQCDRIAGCLSDKKTVYNILSGTGCAVGMIELVEQIPGPPGTEEQEKKGHGTQERLYNLTHSSVVQSRYENVDAIRYCKTDVGIELDPCPTTIGKFAFFAFREGSKPNYILNLGLVDREVDKELVSYSFCYHEPIKKCKFVATRFYLKNGVYQKNASYQCCCSADLNSNAVGAPLLNTDRKVVGVLDSELRPVLFSERQLFIKNCEP